MQLAEEADAGPAGTIDRERLGERRCFDTQIVLC
jgi:hypothetical protein